jgi:flagellar biosynthesis/type III secretory pathway protein FliH
MKTPHPNPWNMALIGVANALLVADDQGYERGHAEGLKAGYSKAVEELGAEGDERFVDWSAPYEYLKQRAGDK